VSSIGVTTIWYLRIMVPDTEPFDISVCQAHSTDVYRQYGEENIALVGSALAKNTKCIECQKESERTHE
jgi:hypothetical protein